MLEYNTTGIYKRANTVNTYIAYKHHKSNQKNNPYIIFLHGLMSDMEGSKATFLLQLCKKLDLNFLAFDNLGHGKSSGEFTHQTISSWLSTTLEMLEQINEPIILVGSSMGAWLALLAASDSKFHHKIQGLITLAAAPDFTETIWSYLTADQRQEMQINKVANVPNRDASHYFPISYQLISDAKKHLLLPKDKLPILCPTIFIHGSADTEVPDSNSMKIYNKVISQQAQLTLLKHSTHRLSDPIALSTLENAIHSIINSSK